MNKWNTSQYIDRKVNNILYQTNRKLKRMKQQAADPKLIESMAMRYRHDFFLLEENEKESIRITMKQLWEEVVGLGFYKFNPVTKNEDGTIVEFLLGSRSYEGVWFGEEHPRKRNNMKKEFIPYEQALELKQLGFDEKCMAIYFTPTKELLVGKEVNEFTTEVRIYAPLYQQAFRWFREKHGLASQFAYFHVPKWTYSILEFTDVKMIPNQIVSEYSKERTYEEAELACLKKLIEIVKNK